MKIAFFGTGHMGAPMASVLIAAGHDVMVWNRSPEKPAPLARQGARATSSPAAAVVGADADLPLTRLARELFSGLVETAGRRCDHSALVLQLEDLNAPVRVPSAPGQLPIEAGE